jgi:two-component system LytT family response regulator
VLPVPEGLVFVYLRHLVWCQAQSNYTVFHLANGRSAVASRSMREFEALLEGHGFFRIHHSHLINLLHVERYVRGKGGYVVMDSGKELEVSVRRRDEFLQRIGR